MINRNLSADQLSSFILTPHAWCNQKIQYISRWLKYYVIVIKKIIEQSLIDRIVKFTSNYFNHSNCQPKDIEEGNLSQREIKQYLPTEEFSESITDSENIQEQDEKVDIEKDCEFSLEESLTDPLLYSPIEKFSESIIDSENIQEQDEKVDIEKDCEFSPEEPLKDQSLLILTEDEVQQASLTLLTTPGLCIFLDKENHVNFSGRFKESFLALVAVISKNYPTVFAPDILRKNRIHHFEQYLALKIKRFAHTFALRGFVSFTKDTKIELEGFHEELIIPMLIASYTQYAKHSKIFNLKDNKTVCSTFNQIILSFKMLSSEIKQIKDSIHHPDFIGPLIIATGYDRHSAGLIILGYQEGAFLLFCDKAGGNLDPGIHVFWTPQRTLITDELITTFTQKRETSENDYLIAEKLMSELDAHVVYYEKSQAQEAGNCTYESMQMTFYALKTVQIILNFSQNKPQDLLIDQPLWSQAFSQIRPEHQAFLSFDQELIFEDFITEVEEWLEDSSIFSIPELGQIYYEVLNVWFIKHEFQLHINQQMLERVKITLTCLESVLFS